MIDEGPDRRLPTSVTATAQLALPSDLAFLIDYGIPLAVLRQAQVVAEYEGVSGSRALLAAGEVSACLYYRCLADLLGLVFEAKWPQLAEPIDVIAITKRGSAKLADAAGWVMAPTDEAIQVLFAAETIGMLDLSRIVLTTPAHLSALVGLRSATSVAAHIADELPDTAPRLSARGLPDRTTAVWACLVASIVVTTAVVAPSLFTDALGLLFFVGMSLRLLICAQALNRDKPQERTLLDADMPYYSVLVPLYHEANIVRDLVSALNAIDYPRSKLEVLFLIESDDHTTRTSLRAIALPAVFRIVDVPEGRPRTKPRALNAGLLEAQGDLLTVYDAEDRPDRLQLRMAAARFAAAGPELSCLQAPLRIYNAAATIVTRLFTIEYAILFDLFNVGTALWRLPMALGGTSNHFRVSALRAIGGWDAWNVTEDADIGLRLARFGYAIDVLESATFEEAPAKIGAWFHQRRRWMKGWLQTSLVLVRDAPTLLRDLGLAKTAIVAILMFNLIFGPILSPFFASLVISNFVHSGLPAPQNTMSLVTATISFSVLAMGIFSTLWCGLEGLRKSAVIHLWPFLPLLVPYQMLISAAALVGLFDLATDPHYWHKTAHGTAA